MVDPRLPSNPTSMLMQAQERKHLVNKLLNLKTHVDKKQPKQFSHLSSGRINQRNDEVRKINSENQQMLKKIMNIMNRKPKGNGLDGVPLKRQNSNEEFDELGSGTMDTFQGNADISLIQSNVDAIMQQQNRFSFEINPHASNLGNYNPPLKTDQSDVPSRQYQDQDAIRENVETEGLKTPDQNHQIEVLKQDSAGTKEMTSSSPNVVREDSGIIEGDNNYNDGTHNSAANNLLNQDQKKISPSFSQENYKNPIQSSSMFDQNLPVTDSEHENRIAFHPQNNEQQSKDSQQQALQSTENQFTCDPDALTFNQEHEINFKPTQKPQKKLFPAQVTLNHGIRKQEVQRINQQNMVMLKALKEIKPCVQHTQNLHKNFVQQEQYRRNLSKFRNVGKSQPKPRPRGDGVNSQGAASEALPDISNRQGAKISPLNAFPDGQKRKMGQRRTSQGYRGKLEPGDGNMAVPVSQRIHYRNQRMNFNSNNVVSEYHGTQSTRQGTDEVIDAEMADDQKSRVQTFPQPVAVSPQNFFQDNQTGSIESSQIGSVQTNVKRPSYLQKLKKSPLLSSMTHAGGIPKSIVNRVISQRDQADTQTFRKYGIVPKIVTGPPSECFYLGQVGAGTSISQSSVISHTRRNRMMQDQIAKLEGKLETNDEIIAEGVIDLEVESVIKKKKPVQKEKKKLSPVRPIKTQNELKEEKAESKKNGATIFTPRQVTAPKTTTNKASSAIAPVAPKAALPAAKSSIKVEEQELKELEKQKPISEEEKSYEIPDQSASDYTPAVSIDPTEIENSTFSHVEGTPAPGSGTETPNLNGGANTNQPVVAQEHQLEHVFSQPYNQESKDFGVAQNMKLNISSKGDVAATDNNQKMSAVSLQDVSGPNEEQASQKVVGQVASRDIGTEQVKTEQGPIKTDPSMPSHKTSQPQTEGSKYSIPDDSNNKIQEESKEEPMDEEEDYQIISLQELEEDNDSGKGGINKLQFVPSQGETKTDLKAQAALRQESQDIDYEYEQQTENSAPHIPLLHQPTNEISEELPSMNSNPAAVTHMAASFPRQTTLDIAEDINRPSGTNSQNLRISPTGQHNEMIDEQEEEVKTIVQSKSMAQNAGGIRKHQSHMAGIVDRTESSQGPKLEKTPTQGEVTRVGGIYAEAGPGRGTPSGTMTQGTGFVSGAGAGAIGQSKENIILSELSSKKNFE